MSGIRTDVEKRFFEFLSDVGDRIGADRVQQILEGAISGASRTKAVVDKNVESLLAIANIPSRREYERMRAKVSALQGSVMNLTRAVDQLQLRLAQSNGKGSGTAGKSTAAVAPRKKAAAKAKRSRAATVRTSAKAGSKKGAGKRSR